jgi:hypothetical protein
MTTHVEQVPTGPVRRFVARLGRTIGQPAPLDMPPEMVHRVQLWRCGGQEPRLDVQRPGDLATLVRTRRCAPVLTQPEVPTAPMGAEHGAERLRRLLDPRLGDEQEELPPADVEGAMEHASGMRTRSRH